MDLSACCPCCSGALPRSSGGGCQLLGAGFAALAIASSIVRWFTTRYRVTEDRVYLRRGLLNQKVLSVARDRVRSVDLTAHLLYRLLGLSGSASAPAQRSARRRELPPRRLTSTTPRPARPAAGLAGRAPARRAGPGDRAMTAGEAAAGARQAASPAAAETKIGPAHLSWIRFAPLTLTGMVIIGVLFGFCCSSTTPRRSIWRPAARCAVSAARSRRPAGRRTVLAVAVTILLCLV